MTLLSIRTNLPFLTVSRYSNKHKLPLTLSFLAALAALSYPIHPPSPPPLPKEKKPERCSLLEAQVGLLVDSGT